MCVGRGEGGASETGNWRDNIVTMTREGERTLCVVSRTRSWILCAEGISGGGFFLFLEIILGGMERIFEWVDNMDIVGGDCEGRLISSSP